MFFALPMQGVASATMMYCGNGNSHAAMKHHDFEQTVSMHHEHSSDQHHQHHHNNSQSDKSSDHGQSKCSVCAACCLGVSIVAPTLEIPSVVVGTQSISFLQQSFTSLVLNGLERPPFSHSFVA
jgi:hypothetical protein